MLNKNKIYGESNFLPEFEVNNTLPIRIISKAVTITFLIILSILIIGGIVIFTVHIDLTVPANGYLEASDVYHLHTPESGIINDVYVSSGDTVFYNEPLAEIDSTEIKNKLLQIETEIALKENSLIKIKENLKFAKRENSILTAKANAQILKAKASFRDRLTNFYPGQDPDSIYENYIPGNHINLDFAMADIYSAEAEIENTNLQAEMFSLREYELNELCINIDQLKEEQRMIRNTINRMVIRSPVEGIMLTEGIDRFVGSYFSEGTLLFEISGLSEWQINLFVNENEIHKIELGDKVKVEVKALQSKEEFDMLNATVTSIAAEQVHEKDQKNFRYSGLYRVTATMEKLPAIYFADQTFKQGFTIKANIVSNSGRIADLLIEYINEII